jgi:hypothetical protein
MGRDDDTDGILRAVISLNEPRLAINRNHSKWLEGEWKAHQFGIA